jgi:hypothetical protein
MLKGIEKVDMNVMKVSFDLVARLHVASRYDCTMEMSVE